MHQSSLLPFVAAALADPGTALTESLLQCLM
jgi:hypothetical protein